jgi:tellurite resistance protein TehA-like permease
LDAGLQALSIAAGVPIMGFALLWAAISVVMLVWAFRNGLGFSIAWWAMPFSSGTVVTGMSVISRHTGVRALGWLATALYAGLCALFLCAWPRTVWGLARRTLPAATPPGPAATYSPGT